MHVTEIPNFFSELFHLGPNTPFYKYYHQDNFPQHNVISFLEFIYFNLKLLSKIYLRNNEMQTNGFSIFAFCRSTILTKQTHLRIPAHPSKFTIFKSHKSCRCLRVKSFIFLQKEKYLFPPLTSNQKRNIAHSNNKKINNYIDMCLRRKALDKISVCWNNVGHKSSWKITLKWIWDDVLKNQKKKTQSC